MTTHPELSSILLAAGGSSRLGRAKQLLELDGETLVSRTARLLTAVCARTVVVTGSRQRSVEFELEDLGVTTVHNDQWREGVGTSIALGVEHLLPKSRAVLILLCDQYRVSRQELQSLIDAWIEEPDRIIAARWEKAFGPPVIFPQRFFTQLGRLRGDLGARQLLVEHRSRVRFMDIPSAAYDVDDAADLARMRRFEATLTG